jgi:glucokinase
MSRNFLLAADVGGTKATLALGEAGAGRRLLVQRVYACQDHAGLESIIADFLQTPEVVAHGATIAAACFSVAGPVADDASTLTNLGWKVDAATLQREFDLPAVRLINDFTAAGQGMEQLADTELETLQAGQPAASGTRLVIGAGTGLGVGLLTWEGGGYAVHPSEAGHADFAPVDELQDRLLAYLRRTFGRVSYERVVSGPGLMRIFSFLQDIGAGIPSRQLLDASNTRQDAAELIAEFGAAKLDPLAARALDLFIAAYGAFAGNMALATLARGGVYISGGIAPKIAPKLKEGGFIRAFLHKDRFSDLLATIPVRVVMNPQVGLFGALLEADRLRRCGQSKCSRGNR